MGTFGAALDKASEKFILTGKKQYIIYNHKKCKYRVSSRCTYSVDEELAKFVDSLTTIN